MVDTERSLGPGRRWRSRCAILYLRFTRSYIETLRNCWPNEGSTSPTKRRWVLKFGPPAPLCAMSRSSSAATFGGNGEPSGGRRGRDQEGRDAARVAPQLRDPPARAWYRYKNYPGAARSRQIGDNGALHACRHRHDRRRRKPARPVVTTAQEAQEEPERPAAGVAACGGAPSSVGGCRYLPRPWGGVAPRQCRARQPRPAAGNVGDRA